MMQQKYKEQVINVNKGKHREPVETYVQGRSIKDSTESLNIPQG